MEFLLAFAFALFLSTVLVPFFMRYAFALGLIDEPTEARKIHTESIPRCGGLGIVFGAFLASIYWLDYSNQLLTLGFAGAVIVLFGYLDDSRDLHYRWKFFGQILATLVLLSGGIVLDRLPFLGLDSAPVYITYPLTLLFVLGVTNAVNLSDGLDGLAAGNSLLGLVLIAFLSLQIGEAAYAVIALALIGGLLGFLRYNTHPAKVFMGDTGSQFLGFVTASLAILLTQQAQSAMSPMLPLLILGLPILDTLNVMLIRLSERRSMFSADRNHIHHKLMSLGFHHYEVVAVLYALQTVLVVIAFVLRYEADWLLLLSYLLFCAGVLGFLAWGKASGWQLRHAEPVDPCDRRNNWVRKIDWYYHHSSHVIEAALALFLVLSAIYMAPTSVSFFRLAIPVSVLLISAWWVCRLRWPALTTRAITYTASAFVVYGFVFNVESRPVFNALIDGYLLAVLVALLLAIRMTKRAVFRLDTHDYLIFFMLLVIPLFPNPFLDQVSITYLVLRFALLVYACEFLLSRRSACHPWLNFSGIVCLVVLGVGGG